MESGHKMDKLGETLEELGIKDVASLEIEIRSHSGANEQGNKQLYEEANKTLLSIVEERNPGECIHITGEMRAFADRLHRLVCRKIWERHKSRFNMVCYLPRARRIAGREILKWNRQNWEDTPWMDHLNVFDLLGDAVANLYALQDTEKMHYSVFADKYVLLQAKHPHPGPHVKEVWLLESRPLNKMLVSKAKEIISRGYYIPPSVFKELTLTISSPTALHILLSLYDKKKIMKEELFHQLKGLKLSKNSYMDLESAGFIEEVGNFVQVTKQGEDYLELFCERKKDEK